MPRAGIILIVSNAQTLYTDSQISFIDSFGGCDSLSIGLEPSPAGAATDHLPVVHEHVGLPQFVGRDPQVLDSAILGLVPAQIVVVPLLHCDTILLNFECMAA